MESQRTILVSVPKHTTFGEFHLLLTNHDFSLGEIRFVEYEMNLLRTHDSNSYFRLLTIII